MRVEPVSSGRAKFEEGRDLSLRIILPPKRNALMILFLCAWLGGWFFGERSAIEQLKASNDSGANGFLTFWLAAWTLGGAFAIHSILWMVLGREILELRSDVLLYRREALGIGRSRAYDLAQIRNLRPGPESPSPFNLSRGVDFSHAMAAWGMSGGPIVFDYGAKTIRCGAALDEAEARLIIERMIQRDGRLGTKGAA